MSLKGAGWGESKRLKRGPSALFGLSASPVQESAQCGLPLGISAPGHVPSAGAIRHSPFAIHHRDQGIFAPTTPSHDLPLYESLSSLPCGFLSPSSWRPASKSAFLLWLPHLYRSSLCVFESLPRPHHSPSLGPSPFSKHLVLRRATAAALPTHNTTDAPSVTAQQKTQSSAGRQYFLTAD